jgi:hypothetical protein
MSEELRRRLVPLQMVHSPFVASVLLVGVMLIIGRQQHGAMGEAPAVNADWGRALVVPAGLVVIALLLMVVGTIRLGRARSELLGELPIARASGPMIFRSAGAAMIGLAGFTASFLHGLDLLPYLVAAPISIVLLLVFFPRIGSFVGAAPKRERTRVRRIL